VAMLVARKAVRIGRNRVDRRAHRPAVSRVATGGQG